MANQPKKILIIEDDIAWAKSLAKVIENEGFAVFYAKNGREGLKACFEEFPDLMILDLVMPGMHGFEVLKRLRSDQWGKKLPVIILSNFPDYPGIEELIKDINYDIFSKSKNDIADVIKKIKEKTNQISVQAIP